MPSCISSTFRISMWLHWSILLFITIFSWTWKNFAIPKQGYTELINITTNLFLKCKSTITFLGSINNILVVSFLFCWREILVLRLKLYTSLAFFQTAFSHNFDRANCIFWTRALNIPFPRSYVFPESLDEQGKSSLSCSSEADATVTGNSGETSIHSLNVKSEVVISAVICLSCMVVNDKESVVSVWFFTVFYSRGCLF